MKAGIATLEKNAENSSLPRKERYRLDDLERSIVLLLREDARMPFQTIARELGVDEKTVRNRISKLRSNGVLNFTVTTDGNTLDGCLMALIGIQLQAGVRADCSEIIKKLSQIPIVSWTGAVMGRYDLIVEVVVDSWDRLTLFQMTELPAIAGIGHTESFLVLSHNGRGVSFVDGILNTSR